ncbi:MAG: nitrile hydratase subunit beta [Phyllobacterium sp.]
MNGPQDLGGQMGFGPVAPEPNEPIFHGDWEKRALGVTLAAGAMGHWNIDESRFTRENRHPVDYYGSSYYEIWIKALETLLTKHGFVTARELARGEALSSGKVPKRVLKADQVASVLAKGGPCNRPVETDPRYKVGDRVRTLNFNPATHTRLPRYARGKTGVVEAVRDGFVFPDSNAHGEGENPQWVYTIVFTGEEIWGEGADPTLVISIDAWESYLEPVAAV